MLPNVEAADLCRAFGARKGSRQMSGGMGEPDEYGKLSDSG
jgi:hypothetical protein